RIMDVPKDFEDLVVSDLGGIEFDLDDFSVPGAVRTHLLVGGIFLLPAGVTGRHGFDTVEGFVKRFQAPEATAAEGGELGRAGFGIGRIHSSLSNSTKSQNN